MKKYLFISVALLAVAAACTPKESLPEDPNPQAPDTQIEEPASVIYIQARGEEQTKASVAGDTGAFSWNTGDKIAVYAGGYKISDGLDSSFDGGNTATFSFSGSEVFGQDGRANYAVYPASLVYDAGGNLYTSAVTSSSLKVNLPASYNLSAIQGDKSPIPMIAVNAPDGSLAFRSICAHLRFKLVSVPKQTQYITFDFIGKKVQGEFTLSSIPDLADAGTLSVFGGAQTSATTGADAVITVYNDGAFSTFQEGLILNIPVPAGIASTGEYLRLQVGGNVDKKRDNLLRSCLSCGTLSNYRTVLRDMQEIYDFAVWMEVYE